MNFGSLPYGAGLAAIGAGLMGVWGYIKTVLHYITGLVIGTVVVKNQAGQAVMSFCFDKAVRSPLGMRVFGGVDTYVHPKRWSETVGYETMPGEPFLMRYKGRLALVGLNNFNKTDVNIGSYTSDDTVCIRYVRGTFKPEPFIIEAIEYFNKQNRQTNGDGALHNRFRVIRVSGNGESGEEPATISGGREISTAKSAPSSREKNSPEQMILQGVYRLLKWSREDLQFKPEEGQTPFTGYPFPSSVAEAILDLERWKANEKWFRSKSIPWRTGWLLHGPPGTGKSTLVRALGMYLNMPVFMFDLSGMSNRVFTSCWDSMLNNTPAIALLEDFDTVFKGRDYVGGKAIGKDHLSFDCVLNCISGVKQADGVFLVVTTNRVEAIDPALGVPDKTTGKSTRPGRIDRAIYLGPMEEPERLMLAKHILSDSPHLVEETTRAGDGETAAQFQARCADLALRQFWKVK